MTTIPHKYVLVKAHCGHEYERKVGQRGPFRKYCETCIPGCSVAECEKTVVARGLCSTHYNRKYQPDRHKAKKVSCVVCGKVALRHGGGGRKYGQTCSDTCKRMLNGGPPERCRIPDDHWVRWIGKRSQWPRYGWDECGWCSEQFPLDNKNRIYCSDECVKDSAWQRVRDSNGWVAHEVTASTDRYCTRCGSIYRSPYVNRVHCSDFCRDADANDRRKARGAQLYYGWISRFDRLEIYERDNYTCWLCNEPVDMEDDPKIGDWSPSLDHVIPRSRGGSHDPENLRTAHRWCNSVRSDNDYHELFTDALV